MGKDRWTTNSGVSWGHTVRAGLAAALPTGTYYTRPTES